MSADNGRTAGEREETSPERNTDDGLDTAPSAGERENTVQGSDTGPSAGERENTEEGSDTAPSAGERYIDSGDGWDALLTSRDLPDSGRPAADVDSESSKSGDYSQPENLGSDQREDHSETEDDGRGQKAPEAGPPPSSPAGSSGNNGKKSVGFICWEQNPDMVSLVERLSPDIGSDRVIPDSSDKEYDWGNVGRFSPVIIICQSQTPLFSLWTFLDFSRTHGTEKMMMVVTDLEDAESERRKQLEWASGGFPRCPLVTLTEADMDVICTSDREDMAAERRMARKVTRMRRILQSRAESSQSSSQPEQNWNKLVVGIFSREAKSQYSWLVDVLTSDIFGGRAPEVRSFYISNSGFQKFSDDDSRCTFGVLYHSKNRGRVNVTDVTDSLYDEELQYLHSRLGKKNVIVVIDDLDDSSDHRKTQIHEDQPSIREKAEKLFLISREEKTSNYQRRLVDRRRVEEKLQKLKDEIMKRKTEAEKSPTENKGRTSPEREQDAGSADGGTSSSGSSWARIQSMWSIVTSPTPKNSPGFYLRSVGIFSRSTEREYSWLQNLLESPDFSNIKHVHSLYISNYGFSRFCDDVSRCTFGILYHSKNRGRVNLTDVNSSLYDEELEYLSSRLGKKNVVVVIDDLDDASDMMKYKLLSSQPKIKTLSQDLILVRSASPEEKKRAARDALKKVLH